MNYAHKDKILKLVEYSFWYFTVVRASSVGAEHNLYFKRNNGLFVKSVKIRIMCFGHLLFIVWQKFLFRISIVFLLFFFCYV